MKKMVLALLLAALLMPACTAAMGEGATPAADIAAKFAAFLERLESAGGEETEPRAVVVDQYGDPVPGAYVTFCTDALCELCLSDENGALPFEGEPGEYHLSVVRVPEGYAFDADAEYALTPQSGEVRIEVTRE